MVPSSAVVMMASLEDSTTALNSRSRTVCWSRTKAASRRIDRTRRDIWACRATLSISKTASTKLAAQSP